jgi:PTH1 family peptidyl-tRNA hydrolase
MSSTSEAELGPGSGIRLILGLGNPGARYAGTRHNRGREVVEELARRWAAPWEETAVCAATVARSGNTLLAMPETYMNRSGYAARCLAERFEIVTERMLVVYDDVALPLGALRLRPSGSPAGQRGMASVIENLRSDEIPRLRLGILPTSGRSTGDLADFVLERFADEESALARRQITSAADACLSWLRDGIETTMNQYNALEPTPVDVGPEKGASQPQ